MATYGIYQVIEPLYVTPTGSVCSAKIVGGEAQGRIAAKIFNPPVNADDPDEPHWEPKYFLDRAQLQRRVAAAGGAHWAPVYASGFTPGGGAYYITDYHALTARKLIDSGVALDAAALHAVVSTVVAGLEEIQRVAGRAHANLKPSNVFLLGSGHSNELRALLCDPGQEYKATRDGEAGDLHALGRLIHELVLHRPCPGSAGAADLAAVGAAPEWAKLGDRGAAWRQLCVDLLTEPIPPQRAATLAAVAKAVATLAPPRIKVPPLRLPGMGRRPAADGPAKPAQARAASRTPRPRREGSSRLRRVAVQALAVLMLVGGGLFVFDTMEASAREELCQARAAWLGSLAASLSEPQRREAYERDPHLRRVVEGVDAVQAAGVDCDGGRIRPLGFLQYTRARGAVTALREVERNLAPENWPQLQRLRELAATLEKRGWQQPAGYVAQLVEGVRPAPAAAASSPAVSRPSVVALSASPERKDGPDGRESPTASGRANPAVAAGSGGNLAARIDRLVRVQPIIEEQTPAATAQWEQLERTAAELERASNPVVRGFGALLRGEGVAAVRLGDEGYEGLPALDQHARLAGRVLAALAEDAKRPIDLARFEAEIVRPAIDPAELELADVETWLERRPLYAVRTPDIQRATKLLGEQFGAMRAKVVESAPEEAERDAFAQAQRDVETALREFGQTPFIAADIDRGAFGKRVSEIQVLIGNLERYYHAEDPDDWLKNLAGVPTSSERIKRAWAAWVAALRDDAKSMAEDRDLFAHRKIRTVALRDLLTEVDVVLPQPPDELSREFKPAAAKRREERIAELLGQLNPAAPALSPDVLKAEATALDDWYVELVALGGQFPIPAARLLTLDDRPDELWAKRKPTFWGDPLVQALVRPDLDRIQRLQRLRGASRVELVRDATAEGPRPEVTVAAWKLLGESANVRPAWPDTAEELKVEAALRERVRAAIQPAGEFEREALREQLANEGPRRWRRFVEAITPEAAEQKLEAAYRLRPSFEMNSTALAEMDAPARFNFWLYLAHQSIQANIDDKALQVAIENLLLAAGELKDAQQARGAGMRAKLAKLEAPEPFQDQDLTDVFTLELPGVAQPLEFRRVAPTNGDRPFYLGTREVTLGQFVGVLRAERRWDEALRLDWPYQPGKPDRRRGSRVWEWAPGDTPTLAPASLWMAEHLDGKNNDFPTEFREQRFNRNVIGPTFGGMPSEQHPMQYVTAQAALFYAAALGCRLPTSAEWRAALEASGQTPENGRWNLRDASWDRFRAYAARESIPNHRWPDVGALADDPQRKPADAPPPSRKGNDATLLLRPAPVGDGRFHDLIGNVAEYVCEEPDAFAGWPANDKATAEGLKRFLDDTPDAVAVIGGSAFSPPDEPLAEPRPLKHRHRGFSDVGLRLAFTAPARNLAERLKWVLAGEEYLAPARTVSVSTGASNEKPSR